LYHDVWIVSGSNKLATDNGVYSSFMGHNFGIISVHGSDLPQFHNGAEQCFANKEVRRVEREAWFRGSENSLHRFELTVLINQM
jgi:hypothetical protein